MKYMIFCVKVRVLKALLVSFDTDGEVEDCIGKFMYKFVFVAYKLTHFIVCYMTATYSLHIFISTIFTIKISRLFCYTRNFEYFYKYR